MEVDSAASAIVTETAAFTEAQTIFAATVETAAPVAEEAGTEPAEEVSAEVEEISHR